MSGVRRLPLAERVFDGESVPSYAPRLAHRNHSSVKEIEAGLRREGFLSSRGRESEERKAVWRTLGQLDPRAFSQPQVVAGNWVIKRSLCPRCSKDWVGTGLLPHVGFLCLKHQEAVREAAWLGQEPDDRWSVLRYSSLAQTQNLARRGLDERV